MSVQLTEKGVTKFQSIVSKQRIKKIVAQTGKDFHTIRKMLARENIHSSTLHEVFKALNLEVKDEDFIYVQQRRTSVIKALNFLLKGATMNQLLQLPPESLNQILSISEKAIGDGLTVCMTAVSHDNPYQNRKCIFSSNNFPLERVLVPHNQMFGLDFTSWWLESLPLLEDLMDSLKHNRTPEGYGMRTSFREELTRPDKSRCWYVKDYMYFPGEPGICLSVGEPGNWGFVNQVS